jgi:hypothetical protein
MNDRDFYFNIMLTQKLITLLMIFPLIIKKEKKELVTPLSAQRRSFHNDKTTQTRGVGSMVCKLYSDKDIAMIEFQKYVIIAQTCPFIRGILWLIYRNFHDRSWIK